MKAARAREQNAREKEERLLKNFLGGGFGRYDSFLVYRSFSAEAGTEKLISYLLSAGKTVYLPRVEGKEMAAVPFSARTKVNAFGIEEPEGESVSLDPDVTVLPLLAVDKAGNRVGYGGGYYDKYLARHQTIKIAYGYDFQVVDGVRKEKYDVAADWIVTDKRLIRARGEETS